MKSNRAIPILAVLAGIVLIAVAVVYWTEPAKSLPFPDLLGHQAGSNTVHVKHGVASFLLGLACFALAWFKSGPRRAPGASR